jgi:hypothetical protein
MLEECVGQLDEPFRRSEIIGWFRRHHPDVNEAMLAAHVQAATANATNRAQNNQLGTRPPLLRRVDHGLYVRAGRKPAEGEPARVTLEPPSVPGTDADVVLVGCVRTKRAAAAAASELFASPLFEGRRRMAVASGLPWYIPAAGDRRAPSDTRLRRRTGRGPPAGSYAGLEAAARRGGNRPRDARRWSSRHPRRRHPGRGIRQAGESSDGQQRRAATVIGISAR